MTQPTPAVFGHNEHGRITCFGIAYPFSSLGETELGLQRAEHFATWLNEQLAAHRAPTATEPIDSVQAHTTELEMSLKTLVWASHNYGKPSFNDAVKASEVLLDTLVRERAEQ